MQSRSQLAALLLAAAFLPACKDRTTSAPPPKPSPTLSTSPRTAAPPEFIQAAQKLEDAVMAADPDAVNRIFDSDALLSTATAGVAGSSAVHDGFVSGATSQGVTATFVALRKAGATYRLLRVFNRDGETHAIFRLLQSDGGLNYNDWTLVRRADGSIHAVDAFVAVTGEYMSQTYHRLYVMAAAAADTSLMSKLAGTDRSLIEHSADISEMAKALREGRNQDVLDAYNRLPASLQHDKAFFLYRLMATSKMMDERPAEYEKVIADYEKQFVGDPSCDIISLDGAYLSKNYPAFYRAIDHLENWTGGDAYLQTMKAGAILEENKPDAPARAEKIAAAAVAAESRLLGPHIVLVKALCLQGKYAQAVAALQIYERLAGAHLSAESLNEMKGLAASKEYIAYRAQQK